MIVDYYIRFIDELIKSGKISVDREYPVVILPTDILLKTDKNDIEWYSTGGFGKRIFPNVNFVCRGVVVRFEEIYNEFTYGVMKQNKKND